MTDPTTKPTQEQLKRLVFAAASSAARMAQAGEVPQAPPLSEHLAYLENQIAALNTVKDSVPDFPDEAAARAEVERLYAELKEAQRDGLVKARHIALLEATVRALIGEGSALPEVVFRDAGIA